MQPWKKLVGDQKMEDRRQKEKNNEKKPTKLELVAENWRNSIQKRPKSLGSVWGGQSENLQT